MKLLPILMGALLLLGLVPPAFADSFIGPGTVANGNVMFVQEQFNGSTFACSSVNGLDWAFGANATYSNGRNMIYLTTADGVTWSAPSNLPVTIPAGATFTTGQYAVVQCVGTTAYIAFFVSYSLPNVHGGRYQANTVSFMKLTLNADRTVTSILQNQIASVNATACSCTVFPSNIILDSTSAPWVAILEERSGNNHVLGYQLPASTWLQRFNESEPVLNQEYLAIASGTAGKVAIVFLNETNNALYDYQSCTSGGCGSIVQLNTGDSNQESYSVANIGDTTYLAASFLGDPTLVKLYSIPHSTLTWSSANTIISTPDPTSIHFYDTGLTTDNVGIMMLPYLDGVETAGWCTSQDAGVTWTCSGKVSTSEPISGATGSSQYFHNPDGSMPMSWYGSGSPVDIRFAALTPSQPVVTVVGACTAFELQCWLYPTFFVSMYLVLSMALVWRGEVSSKDMEGVMLEALTLGTMIAVMMGMINVLIPLLITVVQVVRTIRA